MTVDIHITTCHHSTVKCRDRVGLPTWNNITSWGAEERLEISRISVDSLTRFVAASFGENSIDRFSLLDDGSDLPEAVNWLNSLTVPIVRRFKHRGSSAMLNDYASEIDSDYVFHMEDDNIAFNPLGLNILETCDKILSSPEAQAQKVKVLTFKSALPSEPGALGLHGAWGPKGSFTAAGYHCILYGALGNYHHLMAKETYEKFLPFEGSSGACEAAMNTRMQQLGIKNAEVQIPVYFFHSHKLSYPVKGVPETSDWNKSGEGFEYGIRDMHQHLLKKGVIKCTAFDSYPDSKFECALEESYIY